jgi:hypothetical protein
MPMGELCIGGCCGRVGFDQTKWPGVVSCLGTDKTYIENLASDISRISDCDLVFCGNSSICGNAVRWPLITWEIVYNWLFQGGRMYMQAEHSGNYDPEGEDKPLPPDFQSPRGMHFKCLQDMEQLNNFLLALNVNLTYAGGDYCTFPYDPATGCAEMTPNVGIANACQHRFPSDRFGEIQGGDEVWGGESIWTDDFGKANPEKRGHRAVVCVYQVGDGFFFLSGDSDPWNFCPAILLCDFTEKLLTLPNNQVI